MMNQSNTHVLEVIKNRRSVREFDSKPVPRDFLASILEAGRWAPSGLNNQPWRFVIVEDEDIRIKLANLTKYSSIILLAPVSVAVFLDRQASYSKDKDILAVGACIQNMLLQTHALGLGACWLGEILNKSKYVEALLGVPESYELLAVLAIGYPNPEHKRPVASRMRLQDIIFGSWPSD